MQKVQENVSVEEGEEKSPKALDLCEGQPETWLLAALCRFEKEIPLCATAHNMNDIERPSSIVNIF